MENQLRNDEITVASFLNFSSSMWYISEGICVRAEVVTAVNTFVTYYPFLWAFVSSAKTIRHAQFLFSV